MWLSEPAGQLFIVAIADVCFSLAVVCFHSSHIDTTFFPFLYVRYVYAMSTGSGSGSRWRGCVLYIYHDEKSHLYSISYLIQDWHVFVRV